MVPATRLAVALAVAGVASLLPPGDRAGHAGLGPPPGDARAGDSGLRLPEPGEPPGDGLHPQRHGPGAGSPRLRLLAGRHLAAGGAAERAAQYGLDLRRPRRRRGLGDHRGGHRHPPARLQRQRRPHLEGPRHAAEDLEVGRGGPLLDERRGARHADPPPRRGRERQPAAARLLRLPQQERRQGLVRRHLLAGQADAAAQSADPAGPHLREVSSRSRPPPGSGSSPTSSRRAADATPRPGTGSGSPAPARRSP